MLDLSLWLPMFQMDYQYGWFGKDYFKGLVANGTITAGTYQKIVGEAYVAPQNTVPAQA